MSVRIGVPLIPYPSRHREPGAVVGFAVGLFAVCALVALACVGVST